MSGLARPQTAPTKKPQRVRSAQSSRPLGRFAQPIRDVAQSHGSNETSVFASIRGDIVTLQHIREKLSNPDGTALPSMTMQALEQQLSAFSAIAGDPLQTAENKAHLLEMLVQVMRSTSHEALQTLDMSEEAARHAAAIQPPATGSHHHPASRVSGFVELLDKVILIGERKKMWGTLAQKEVENAEVQVSNFDKHPSASVRGDDLDAALNEPAVSQLRSLINQQRKLQQKLTEVAPVSSERAIRPGLSESVHQPVSAVKSGPTAEEERLKQSLAKANQQVKDSRSRILELELELKKLQDESTKALEDAEDFNKIISEVTFHGVDTGFLQSQLSIETNLKIPNPGEAESQTAGRIATILHDLMTGASPSGKDDEKRKNKKDTLSASSLEGGLWVAVQRQNQLLKALTTTCKDYEKRLNSFTINDSKEVQRLSKLVKALEQKIKDQGSTATRTIGQKECELASAQETITNLENTLKVLTKAPERKRLVNVKGQTATASEREDSLRAELAHSRVCVKDLSEKLQSLKEDLEQEQAGSSAIVKERQQLLHKLDSQQKRNEGMEVEVTAKQNELGEQRDLVHALRKDIREKSAVEADLQQRLWKMEVELHISQNVINDLRLREEELSKRAADAKKCQENLRDSIDKERKESALKFARLEEQLRLARANERAAKENLRSERSRMLGNEKEVERLRALDTQMEMLENNFTNYAASKLAQRDAQEEDERQLEACVEQLMRDVFELPLDEAAEDEVALYLQRLKTQASALENEDRLRRLSKVTIGQTKGQERGAKKQLVNILQERYNQIQIFAAEQRIRQISSEKETYRTTNCYGELKSEHERCLQDLSLSKVQCESLVQRNTELELERTQLLRNRASAEMEIKNLKATLQRLKMHGEEQEKILIEVGTQLQNQKIKNDGAVAEGGPPPLGMAIIGGDE